MMAATAKENVDLKVVLGLPLKSVFKPTKYRNYLRDPHKPVLEIATRIERIRIDNKSIKSSDRMARCLSVGHKLYYKKFRDFNYDYNWRTEGAKNF